MIEWIQSIPCPLIKRLLGPGCRVFSHSICIEKCHVRLEMEWISQSNQSKIITRWSEESGQKIEEGSKQEQVVRKASRCTCVSVLGGLRVILDAETNSIGIIQFIYTGNVILK